MHTIADINDDYWFYKNVCCILNHFVHSYFIELYISHCWEDYYGITNYLWGKCVTAILYTYNFLGFFWYKIFQLLVFSVLTAILQSIELLFLYLYVDMYEPLSAIVIYYIHYTIYIIYVKNLYIYRIPF